MLKHPDYNSPAELKTFLEQHGMAMQKKFGQNFLINENYRKRIVDALDIKESTTVWEVGPGLGCMTEEILNRGARLTVFEIDKGFAACNREFFESYGKDFSLVEGDVLKTWKRHFQQNGQAERFFGNLPYNIAATLIADTIENGIRFEKCVFTVQKEVALRMAAKPGTEDYSSFSVLCTWAYNVKPICDLSGSNFWPKPNVDSRAVLLEKREDFPKCSSPALFSKMQRALFSSRRKTVKNNLTQFLSSSSDAETALKKSGIDPLKRAEAMSIEELLMLSDFVNDVIISRQK